MYDVLEDLYYGNINPNEQQKLNKHLMKKISEAEEELLKLLDGEKKELFKQYTDAHRVHITQIKLENFKTGYQLGSWLTAETHK
ncbi:MAG: hypothetical protein FWE74_10405 [Oscillospiraceae bacterium]|nr:hypothetical protein [Oscillospiraceae bacterium]